MAELYFKVSSDVDNVVRLSTEIDKLEAKLQSFSLGSDPMEIEKVAKRLAEAKQALLSIVDDAAKAGASLEAAFKKANDMDMTNPTEQLKSFDTQLLKMCSNLDGYFDELKGKLQDMLGVLGGGQTIADNIKINDDNIHKVEELNKINAELRMQVKQLETDLQRTQEQFQQIANTVKGETTSSVKELSQAQMASAVQTNDALNEELKRNDEIKKSLEDKKAEVQSLTEELKRYQSEYNQILHIKDDDGWIKRKVKENVFVSQANAGNVDEAVVARVVQLNDKIEETKQKIADAKNETKQLSNEFSESNNRVTAMRKELATMTPAVNAIDAATKRITLDTLSDSINDNKRKMDDLAGRMNDLSGSLYNKEKYLAKLELDGGDEQKIAQLKSEIEQINTELGETKNAYNQADAEAKKLTEEANQLTEHHVRMRTQIMNAREQLMQMIAAGQQGTPQFRQLAEQAGAMRRQMALANATMQYFANPTRHIAGLKSALQGAAGAASLVTGVIGIFNQKSEKMAEIQTKIQSYMGVLVGLESAYAVVKKTSNAMQLISEIQTWAETKAKLAGTVATEAGTVATMKATVAQAAFNAVAKANPYVLLAMMILTVVGGIYTLVKALGSETEAEKKAKEAAEAHAKAVREAHEKWANAVAQSAGKQIASYNELRRKWAQLGNDLNAKKKFILENKSAFNELGWSVDNVTDAEKFLVQNTDAVVRAILARAKAAAYQQAIADEWTKAIKERDRIDNTVAGGGFRRVFHEGDVLTQEDVQRYNRQYGVRMGGGSMGTNPSEKEKLRSAGFLRTDVKLSAANAAYLNSLEQQDANKRWKANVEQLEKRTQERIQYLTKGLEQAEKEVVSATGNIGVSTFNTHAPSTTPKPDKKDTTNSDDPNEKIKAQMLADQEAARTRRNNLLLQEQAQIDMMADGNDKELAQMRLNHKKRMAEIDDEQEDILNKKREQAAEKTPNYYVSGAYEKETLTNDELLGVDSERISANTEYEQNVMEFFKKLETGSASALDKMNALKKSYSDIIGDIDNQIETLQSKSDRSANENALLATLQGLRANIDEQYLKSQESIYNELLLKYQTFQQRKVALEKQYNDDVAVIQSQHPTDDAGIAAQQAALSERQRQFKIAMEAINNEEYQAMQKASSFLIDLFGNAADMSQAKIRELIQNTQMLLTYIRSAKDDAGNVQVKDKNGNVTQTITKKQITDLGFSDATLETLANSPEKIQAIQKALQQLQEQGRKNNPFKKLADDISSLFKKKNDEGERKIQFKDLAKDAAACADVIGNVAGQLSEMFDSIGNQSMAEAFEAVQDAMTSVSNIANGFAQGGLIGGIAAAAGEAINLVGKALQANARHKEALKQVMREALAQQREYNLLLLQQNLAYKEADTIFGSMNWNKAINAVQVMKDAYKQLNEEIKGIGKRLTHKGLFDFEWVNDAYAGLRRIEIKTGHKKTGLFGWGKGKDTYSSILDVYPKLIKANGEFDKELAQTILDTREMTDDNKAALQSMIDYATQAEEAWQQVHDYFSNIFGSFGDTLTDCLVDAFINGKSAANDFADSVSDMLETLAKQMVFSMVFSDIIENAQSQIEEVTKNGNLTSEQKFKEYARIVGKLTDDVISKEDDANALFQKFKDEAAKHGLTIFDESVNQQASSKGFQALSQDTGEELNGRFTAVQIATEKTSEQMVVGVVILTNIRDFIGANNGILQSMNKVADETLTYIVASYSELQLIRENTDELLKHADKQTRSLEKIEKNTKNM